MTRILGLKTATFKATFGDIDINNIPFVHQSRRNEEDKQRTEMMQRIIDKSVFSSNTIGFDYKYLLTLLKPRDPDIYIDITQRLPVSCWTI